MTTAGSKPKLRTVGGTWFEYLVPFKSSLFAINGHFESFWINRIDSFSLKLLSTQTSRRSGKCLRSSQSHSRWRHLIGMFLSRPALFLDTLLDLVGYISLYNWKLFEDQTTPKASSNLQFLLLIKIEICLQIVHSKNKQCLLNIVRLNGFYIGVQNFSSNWKFWFVSGELLWTTNSSGSHKVIIFESVRRFWIHHRLDAYLLYSVRL